MFFFRLIYKHKTSWCTPCTILFFKLSDIKYILKQR